MDANASRRRTKRHPQRLVHRPPRHPILGQRPDPRAWFADHGLGDQPILWDAYILFDAQTVWANDPAPAAFGDPIIGDTDTLNEAISAYIN